jgi:hypothetical protein
VPNYEATLLQVPGYGPRKAEEQKKLLDLLPAATLEVEMARAEEVALLCSETGEVESATLKRLAGEARAEAATHGADELQRAGSPVAATPIDGQVGPTTHTLESTFVDSDLFGNLKKFLTVSDLENLLHRDTRAFNRRPDWSTVFQEIEHTEAAAKQDEADAKAGGESTKPRTAPGETEPTHPVAEPTPETVCAGKPAGAETRAEATGAATGQAHTPPPSPTTQTLHLDPVVAAAQEVAAAVAKAVGESTTPRKALECEKEAEDIPAGESTDHEGPPTHAYLETALGYPRSSDLPTPDLDLFNRHKAFL